MPLWLWWQLYLDEKEFQFPGGRGENVQVLGPQRRWGDIIHWAAGIFHSSEIWKINLQFLLQSAVSKSGQRLSEEEMNAIFVIGDVDQNGEIDLEEFKRMMLPTSFDVVSKFRSVHKTTRDVQNAFRKFDINNDGSIDRLVFKANFCCYLMKF